MVYNPVIDFVDAMNHDYTYVDNMWILFTQRF